MHTYGSQNRHIIDDDFRLKLGAIGASKLHLPCCHTGRVDSPDEQPGEAPHGQLARTVRFPGQAGHPALLLVLQHGRGGQAKTVNLFLGGGGGGKERGELESCRKTGLILRSATNLDCVISESQGKLWRPRVPGDAADAGGQPVAGLGEAVDHVLAGHLKRRRKKEDLVSSMSKVCNPLLTVR